MNLELIVSINLKLLKLGGAIVGNSTQIGNRFFNGKMLRGAPRCVIVISSHLKKHLTDLEFQAIYYHEQAHHELGHLTGKRQTLFWQMKELEADKYAADKVGAANVLSALEKIPEIVRHCAELRELGTRDKSDEQYTESINRFLNKTNKAMFFRYAVLRAATREALIKG